jgi:sec-independent protein translocase protein TatA
MPNIGGPEIIIIFIIVLLLFGAKKIPELARGLGKSMGEFKKARTEFEDEIKRATESVDDEEKPQKRAPSPAETEARDEDSDSTKKESESTSG